MQTFLPYPSFMESAKSLDKRRLNKQKVEANQILKALRSGGGWSNHPATRMWRGYESALCFYRDIITLECINRGMANTMPFSSISELNPLVFPKWLGNPDFHTSHRSNLLRKDPIFYGRFGWKEPSNLPYVWPV